MEGRGHAGVMRRLEVATTDHRIEVPTRQRESRQHAQRRVSCDEVGQWSGMQPAHRLDAGGEPQRREWIATAAADLDHQSWVVEAHPARDVVHLLEWIVRNDHRLQLAPPPPLGYA